LAKANARLAEVDNFMNDTNKLIRDDIKESNLLDEKQNSFFIDVSKNKLDIAKQILPSGDVVEKPDLSKIGVSHSELMFMITNLQVENLILKKQVEALEGAFPEEKTTEAGGQY